MDLGEAAGPTGVAVDGDGKIWATGYASHKAYRIDPTLGDVGADDLTHVGAVDFVTPNLGGYLYNYSDMTGSTLQGAPTSGSWTTTYDTGFDDAEWGTVSWNALLPGDAELQVLVASSLDNVVFGPEQAVVSGSGITVDNGRYLRIRVLFNRSSAGESPILYDLRVSTECGNGILDPGEECDDGNSVNGDGCSATCAIENHPPQAICTDVTVSADAQCLANASIDNGSSDPDGDPIVCVQNPGGPYALGVAGVTLACTDPRGATDSCTANVTVVDSTGPAISCPPSAVVECSAGAAPVSFSHPTATDNCAIAGTSCTAVSGDVFPLGTTNVSCTAADGAGNSSDCDFDIVVADTTPPEVGTSTIEPLWSPNHKYVTRTLADCGVVVQDVCQGPISLTEASAAITCVTSDEPDNGLGDGDQETDMVIVDAETVMLRAERSGHGDGRVYQIHFTVSDAAGNVSQDVCEVTVPRNRSKAITVNSGVQSTVGTCQ